MSTRLGDTPKSSKLQEIEDVCAELCNRLDSHIDRLEHVAATLFGPEPKSPTTSTPADARVGAIARIIGSLNDAHEKMHRAESLSSDLASGL